MSTALLALAFAASKLQPTPGLDAAALRAEAAMNLVAECVEERGERRLLEIPAGALLADLRGIYGSAFARIGNMVVKPPPCPTSRRALGELRAAARELRRLAAIDAMRFSKGLWIGPIQACGRAVANAQIAKEPWGGVSAEVSFTPDSAAALGRFSADMVDQVIPVRVDGRVISRPHVEEPVSAAVTIHGGNEADTYAIVQAARRQVCD